MALIRARQRSLTAVSPHQANRLYIVPSRKLGGGGPKPLSASAAITPGSLSAGDTATLNVYGAGGAPPYATEPGFWTRDGVDIPGEVNWTYDIPQDWTDGDVLANRDASVTDADLDVATADAPGIPVKGFTEAPGITAPPVITGAAIVGGTLTGTPGPATGTPPPTSSLQWTGGGLGVVNGATYGPIPAADEGKKITCTQTASNGVSPVATASAQSATIAPEAGGWPAVYAMNVGSATDRAGYQSAAAVAGPFGTLSPTGIGDSDTVIRMDSFAFAAGHNMRVGVATTGQIDGIATLWIEFGDGNGFFAYPFDGTNYFLDTDLGGEAVGSWLDGQVGNDITVTVTNVEPMGLLITSTAPEASPDTGYTGE